ncbi:hypothetical protein BD779DRAFT_1572123 [Infundibulicybe gibba]|nr:hypothetical protein BD779DRAFT_1572123 [Infundibulicybe gibba]
MTPLRPSQTSITMDLPVDVIQEIFLQCVLAPCRLPPKLAEPRLVLTRVCSAWREVALGVPKLWTDIIVDPQHPGFSVHGHAIISTWLPRSFPCPISLQIHRAAHGSSLFKDLIIPNLHRCRHLDLRTFGSLPDLEDIQINGMGQSKAVINFVNHEQIATFQGCPELCRIEIYTDSNEEIMDLRRLNLPWRQLSALFFGWIEISPISCLNILRECILLQECNLSISSIDDDAIDELTALSKQPLLLPSLHTLSLTLVNHPTLFLAALHMPNLHIFSPMGQWDSFQWSLSSPTSSFLRLDTLNLSQIGAATDNVLSEFLPPLQLTKLYLPRSVPLSSADLRGLSSGTLVPSVTSIVFGPISVGGLFSVLEKRLAASRGSGSGISVFTSVSSDCTLRPTGPKLIARLEVLEAAGIRVEFNPYPDEMRPRKWLFDVPGLNPAIIEHIIS